MQNHLNLKKVGYDRYLIGVSPHAISIPNWAWDGLGAPFYVTIREYRKTTLEIFRCSDPKQGLKVERRNTGHRVRVRIPRYVAPRIQTGKFKVSLVKVDGMYCLRLKNAIRQQT